MILMQEGEEIGRKNLPWFYRLILKVPGKSFLESSGGIFWAVVVPMFMTGEFFLTMLLLVCFPFPANLILAATIPTLLFALFIRIQLERFITWWNSVFAKSRPEWNIGKTLDEYVALLEKKKRDKYPHTEQ